jgi:hypothetical protein
VLRSRSKATEPVCTTARRNRSIYIDEGPGAGVAAKRILWDGL